MDTAHAQEKFYLNFLNVLSLSSDQYLSYILFAHCSPQTIFISRLCYFSFAIMDKYFLLISLSMYHRIIFWLRLFYEMYVMDFISSNLSDSVFCKYWTLTLSLSHNTLLAARGRLKRNIQPPPFSHRLSWP
jgi:hypothetical protein